MAFGITADFENTESKSFDKIETPAPSEKQPTAPTVETPVNDDTLDVQSLQNKEKPSVTDILEPLEAAKPEDKKETPPETKPLELNDDAVLNYLNSKNNTEFKTIDDFKNSFIKEVEKPIEKEVNPYADVMDEEDKAYFDFKKSTHRSRKEFDFLAQDFSKKSALELSIEKIKLESGLDLTDKDAKEHLEKTLDIEDIEDLSMSDKIKLNTNAKPYLDSLLEQQEKFRAPLEEALRTKPTTPQASEKYITQDGRALSKEDYEKETQQVQREYLENIAKGVSSATPLEFDIEIGDDSDKRNLKLKYDWSEKDKQSMLSDASNIDAMIKRRYNTENGFDHSQLAKGLWLGDEKNLQKVISTAVQQAHAEFIADKAASDNNENFSRAPLDTRPKTEDGYGSLEIGKTGANQGFGVKVNI